MQAASEHYTRYIWTLIFVSNFNLKILCLLFSSLVFTGKDILLIDTKIAAPILTLTFVSSVVQVRYLKTNNGDARNPNSYPNLTFKMALWYVTKCLKTII